MHGIIENLINELTRLPGIGRKSAQRLAFFILSMSEADALAIARAIERVKEKARSAGVVSISPRTNSARYAATSPATGAGSAWLKSRATSSSSNA
jgi:endonuclease III